MEPLIGSYGNQFGLNTTWQFFSPNPGSLRYLDYNAIIESEDKVDIESYTFPPQGDEVFFKTNQARMFYYMVRMITHSQNIADYLIPYLCRKHPQATSIAIKAVDKQIPTMEKARLQHAEDFSELWREAEIPEQEFGCSREISL